MRVLFAGGGTGGHLYPAIALAEEVTARGGEVMFVGTSRGIEARVVPPLGYPLELLEVSGLKRMGLVASLRGLGRLPVALLRSLSIVRKFRPDAVVGVGGYASGPLVLAAALAGYPTAICEQNSVPGMTNRILGRLARTVFIAFDDARAHFAAKKIVFSGNPVRRKFLDAAAQAARSGGSLLVVGGSQGAKAVNDLMIGAAELLHARGQLPPTVHQAGAADAERLGQRCAAVGLADRVRVLPFIDDMAAAYFSADLIVGRAGALTLAELAIVGRPAILIPLPTATDDHQSKNAEAFAAAGAAVVLRQSETTAETLAATIETLMRDSARRQAMSSAMQRLARPLAARDIVDRLEALTRSG